MNPTLTAKGKLVTGLITGMALAVIPGPASAQDDGFAPSTASPVSFDREILAGVGIPEGDLPVPAEDIMEGEMKVHRSVLHNGEELRVVVFESTPAKAALREPFTYDEFVYILSGKLILTESDGARYEYSAGDALVVPKGFTGTWEMQGNYREIAVLRSQP
jgi:uncharacterized cupin superfamily protein